MPNASFSLLLQQPTEGFASTADGISIAYNHYQHSTERSTVWVLAPGWHMTKDSKVFQQLAAALFQHNDVMVLDFRGHGRSGGRYTFSALEIQDLAAVVAVAQEGYERVVLMGFSLGGAVALQYAETDASLAGVLTISAPASFEAIENHWFKPKAFLPTFQKFEWHRSQSIRIGNPFLPKRKPLECLAKIEALPLFFLGGDCDPTVSIRHTQQLYDAALAPKRLSVYQQHAHAEDLFLESPHRFLQECQHWLEQLPPLSGEEAS